MASFTAGTTFVDGVANDVTAAKLGALVTNATPTSGFIQDRTAETIIATNDTFLIGDASDSNNLKRMTVANFTQTLPTVKVTTGTIETGTFGTTTSTAATITSGTINTGTFGTTTSTAATITSGTVTNLASTTGTIATLNSTTGTIATLNSTTGTITTGVIPTLTSTTLITTGTGTAAAPAIVPTGDTNTGIFFPAADTIAATTNGTECLRIDSGGNVIISSNKSLISNGAAGIASNTSIGSSALSSNTTGAFNTVVGVDALSGNTTGSFNTSIGYDTLAANTTGEYNTAVGANALDSNTTGSYNTALGQAAMGGNTTGVRNVAVGLNALFANTTGSQNTSCGYAALDANTTGLQNTACGHATLGANTTGNLNTAIGFNSGSANTTGTNNTFIGNSASNTSGGATASNTIVLGNSAITTLRCQTATISALSDARDKSNIEDIPVGIEFIKDLRPVKFTWNQRDGMRVGLTDAGFIAQESLDVVNKYNANWIGLVEDENKDQLAMTPGKLIPILVKAIQQISAKVDSLESQLANK